MFTFNPGVTTTSRGYKQVNPVEIKRAYGFLRNREIKLGNAERRAANSTPGTMAYSRNMSAVEKARNARNYTRARIESMLAHVAEHNLKNMKPQAVKAHAVLLHFIRVKEDAFLAATVAGRNSESDAAFSKLVERCNHIIRTHIRSSHLENDDAYVGALMGVLDAALRYCPERSQAIFTTVAYNWIRRNTRVRHKYDVRDANLASLDQIMEDEEQQGRMDCLDDRMPRQQAFRLTAVDSFKPYASLQR